MTPESPTRNISVYGDVWRSVRSELIDLVDAAIGQLCPSEFRPNALVKTYLTNSNRRVKMSEANLKRALDEFDSLSGIDIKCSNDALIYVGYRWSIMLGRRDGVQVSIVDDAVETLEPWISFGREIDHRLESPYTTVYRIPCGYSPFFFHSGILAGTLALRRTDRPDPDDTAPRCSGWAREFSYRDGQLRPGPIRDIYPFSILNRSQVEFAPHGESLQAAIKRLRAGTLSRLENDRFAWDIDETLLPTVRQPLIDGGFTIYP